VRHHSNGGWDTHRENWDALSGKQLPPLDEALSALFAGLEMRGLLDSTVVYVTGEFGRTPKINKERKNIVVSRREIIEEARRGQKLKILADIKAGQLRKGVVKNITDFGAFVDLDGIDGLLHVTDMSWGRINHPTEMVKVGQEIEVMILEVDLVKERISLGLKQTLSNPWEDIDAKYPIGTRIRGKVVSLAPYGALCRLKKALKVLCTFPKFPGPNAFNALRTS